jgi:hypothetical protein
MAEAGIRGREWNTGRLKYHRHSYRRPVSNHGASASDSTSAHLEPHVEDAVAEELVDVSPGIDDGGHDDLEQGVEAGNRVLGGDSTPR